MSPPPAVYDERCPYLLDLTLDAGKPVVLVGRYDKPGKGIVTVRGRLAGRSFAQQVAVAVENDRLVEAEQQRANQLSQAL